MHSAGPDSPRGACEVNIVRLGASLAAESHAPAPVPRKNTVSTLQRCQIHRGKTFIFEESREYHPLKLADFMD